LVDMPTPRRSAGLAAVLATSLVLPVALLTTPTVRAVPAEHGTAGMGDGYFPFDGNGGYDVKKYRIRNRYAFATRRLSGHTTLRVRATQDLASFNLDFLLPVDEVRIDGRRVPHSRPRAHEVRVTPRRVIADGERFTVRVAYAGSPSRRSYGGETNWLAGRYEVVAMNQPHMAPWWFPSNDHPADKARMDIAITVPRGNQVFANGRPVSRRVHGGLVTRRWVAREPMATYLAMFAAGRFRVDRGIRDGLPWLAVVSKQLPPRDRRSNMALLRRTPKVVAALEEDLGEYPFSRIGGLVTSLDPGFALETQTLPTYSAVGRSATWLVVHEIAHQWFGDSVTLRRWRDIWLNEGAATFMEIRWEETHRGTSGEQWLRDRYDGPHSGSFWNLPIGDPGPAMIFAIPVYDRGAMTFQALRNRVGEADFWTILQAWVTDRRHGHGTRAAFHTLAEDVSGEDLDGFFDAWLSSGKPADTAANGLG
jgi:aminopeptidase N